MLKNGGEVFSQAPARPQREQAGLKAELYEQIGRPKMEPEWLKKLPASGEAKRAMIEPERATLSIRCQCQLPGLSRVIYYYTTAQERTKNLALMRLIDALYSKTPFYGYPRMTVYLRIQGYRVNPKHRAVDASDRPTNPDPASPYYATRAGP